jgi:anti-anti-sigma factor
MDLQVKSDGGGVYTVYCPEQMEWRARGDLVDKVRQASEGEEVSGIIVDLGNVTFLSSAGIGALFTLHEFAREHDAAVVIARPRPAIRRLLDTIKLPDLIPTVKSVDAARRQLHPDNAPPTS